MKKNVLKLTAATFAIIGTGIILFNSAAEMALAANNGKVEKVPTSYQVSDSLETALPKPETKEEDGGKVNYFVSMDSLNTGTPTDTDLTMEEAAETGNQYLKNIYGLDLEGQHDKKPLLYVVSARSPYRFHDLRLPLQRQIPPHRHGCVFHLPAGLPISFLIWHCFAGRI